ncbi:TAT leader-containing periplasmic protein [Shewanella maritima]|uniref:TAT leader-containing periplasmic protein n=1 Tax=Shewanella maritima TaxID=2520507 RepID=UPI003735E6B3
MKRRTLLTGAFVGTAALALGVQLIPSSFESSEQDTEQNSEHRLLFAALIPVLLDGALPQISSHREQAINRTLDAIGATISALPETQQEELEDLLQKMESRFYLLFLSGSMTPVLLKQPDELIDMLESWRNHYTALLQSAYVGLREVIMASYYSCPEHWARMQYAKPNFIVNAE